MFPSFWIPVLPSMERPPPRLLSALLRREEAKMTQAFGRLGTSMTLLPSINLLLPCRCWRYCLPYYLLARGLEDVGNNTSCSG